MGLSSSDSGSGGGKDVGNGPSSMNHDSLGSTLMGMIKQRYPIAGAVGSAVGIGGGSPATGVNSAPVSGGPIPLPEINMMGNQQAPIDPEMIKAGQIGSQHSPLAQMLKAMFAGG